MAEKKNIIKRYGLRLIGVILLIIVLSRVDWHYLGISLHELSIKRLLIVIPLFILLFPVKALRWFYILRCQYINLTGRQAFGYYTSAIYWGLMTPGKIGEFVKVYYLTRRGVPTGKAIVGILVERLSDIFSLMIFSIAWILEVCNWFSWPLITVITTAALVFLMVILKHVDFFLKKCRPLISVIAKKFKKDPGSFLEDFKKDLTLFSGLKMFVILTMTLLSWVVYVIPLYLLGTMLNLNISPMLMVMSILLSCAVTVLPISIGGVGTRDSFLILYLGQYGVLKEKALLFSFMFIYNYLVAVIFSWLVYMMLDIKKAVGNRQ
jgi:uncharacterized protein (TIRG00374 family)